MHARGIRCADALDQLALSACQVHNFGNAGNWFFSFRGGYYGVVSRINGLQRHSSSLHQWRASSTVGSHEHDIAVMLFCMDSAIECFVFMLNALGQAVNKPDFRDIRSEAQLRRISPSDILGGRNAAMAGYGGLFPQLQIHWQAKKDLITLITENHDVTKHRQQAGVSGKGRNDPPPGFLEKSGLPSDPILRAMHGHMHPMEEVLLPLRPKMPIDERPRTKNDLTTLEAVEKDFYLFMAESFCLTLEDARRTIKLNSPPPQGTKKS